VVGGLVLLLAGILLLLLGGWLSAGSPAEFEFWLVLVGVIVLGASMFAMLLGDTPTAPPAVAAPLASEPGPVEAVAEVSVPATIETPAVAVTEVSEPPSPEPPAPEPAPLSRPITTSIPGAYLASLGTAPPSETVPWDEPAPPIAASLPFVAMPRLAEDWSESARGAGDADSALLEVELARLRARVRELESAPSPAPVGSTPSLAPSRSGASRTVPSLISAAEPPKPALSVTGSTRACVGCGTVVPTKGPDLRCGSCGRLLCTTCYWRYGSGAGLQRCPDCRRAFEESGRTAISGGRAGPAIISPSSSASTALFR
jgi:hypothetical protein